MNEKNKLIDKMLEDQHERHREQEKQQQLAALKREHQLKRLGELLRAPDHSEADLAEIYEITEAHRMSAEDVEICLEERRSALEFAEDLKHLRDMKVEQATATMGVERHHSERQRRHLQFGVKLQRLQAHEKLVNGEVGRVEAGWKYLRNAARERPWLFEDIELPSLDRSFEYSEVVENYKRAFMSDLPGYIANRIHEAPEGKSLIDWEWKIRDDYEAGLLECHSIHGAPAATETPDEHSNIEETTPHDAPATAETVDQFSNETSAPGMAADGDTLGEGQPSTPADVSSDAAGAEVSSSSPPPRRSRKAHRDGLGLRLD